MKAVLFGYNGLVGSNLFKLLLENPLIDSVATAGRSDLTSQNPKHRHYKTDFSDLNELAHIFSADVVFCCLGTTIAKAGSQDNFRKVDYHYPLEISKIASKSQVKKLIIVSSVGADAGSSNFYLKTKGEMEEAVRQQMIPQISFMQPGLLLGRRQEFRFGERLAVLIFPLFNPLLVGKLAKYKAVRALDVAAAMLQIALQDDPVSNCNSLQINVLANNYFKRISP